MYYRAQDSKGVVTNYGDGRGATKWEGGGAKEVLPLEKRVWGRKRFSHAEGGRGNTF